MPSPTLFARLLVFETMMLTACAGPVPVTDQQTSQASTLDIGLTARIHFNTQTSDFARSRAFYRMLGFTAGVGGFPKTNTHLMARSLGMDDLCTYEIQDIEVIAIPDSWGPTSIDLIQFAVPFNPAPPYASPIHLGMAYAALLTTDLAADVAYLRAQGVAFLSEPYGVPGNRFVFFRDPDGVLFKLVETAPPHGDPDADMHVKAMPYVALNVSDFDRSLAFYRMLGYSEVRPLPATGTLAEARAYGLDTPFELRGADIAIPGGDRHRLRLVQWLEPFDDDPPYPPPINHIGIDRIALAVVDLDRAVARLQEHGAEFLSETAPCCSGTGEDETGIINLIDPDGIYLELVGPIARRAPVALPEWCDTK
jgi:catechol 2,3-dioxygenase-like lactoylglutathione lyase family enzyme